MKRRVLTAVLAAGLVVIIANPAVATPPALSAGMIVHDMAGGEVGTIDSLAADSAVIATGTHKVALPVASFGTGARGPVIAMTKAELDAAAAKAAANEAASLRAQMLPGVAVFGSQGNNIGTIKVVEGDFVVLTTAHGDAKLPISSVGSGSKGLTIGMSASDFHAALGKS